MLFSPLEQFIIVKPVLFEVFSLFSTATYNIVFIYISIGFLLHLSKGVTSFSFMQYVVIRLFLLVAEVSIQNIKLKKQIYILHLFITFLFILIANLIGLLPYSFSLTSHFSVTFFISFSF